MRSSTLVAGLFALLIACGVSFGAGYFVAKDQVSGPAAPRTIASAPEEDEPSLDGGKPLQLDRDKSDVSSDKPASQPEIQAPPAEKPQGKPAPSATQPDGQPTVESVPADSSKPAPKNTEPTPSELKDKLKELEGKLKDARLGDPEDFENIFNGPQVDFSATVAGQIVDQAGVAVAGATVHASYSENYSSGEGSHTRIVMALGDDKGAAIATTDGGGFFTATISRKIGEKSTLQVSLTGTSQGYAESEKTTFTLKNGDTKEGVKLSLRGAGSVSGRVVDATGRGVTGVKVSLNTSSGGTFYGTDSFDFEMPGSSKHTATSDATGEFTIEGVAEGRYKFRLSGAGYRQISGPTEIDVKAGQSQRAPADFQVAATSCVTASFSTGTGQVDGWATLNFKDDSGKVVKRLNGQVTKGAFEKNDPPAGTFDVEIVVWGYKPHTVRATVVEGQPCDLGGIVLESSEEGGSTIILPGEDE